jgi:phosphatidylserine decarboxylase
MMEPIYYINRQSGQQEVEEVYEAKAIQFAYGDSRRSRFLGTPLKHLASRFSLFSKIYGWCQKQPFSKKKIKPFIDKFKVDTSEFLEKVEYYPSFNDFFIRKLKQDARPIAEADAIIPADGRYFFYPSIDLADGFVVKGEKFTLASLLKDDKLAEKYEKGTMVIARLCPSDYHRFHFPCDCVAKESKPINGWLYSVNPLAIKKNIHIFTQNKRTLNELHTDLFGKVLYIAIGATCVGTIHETYTPFLHQIKGSEKGYFSFGGSSLILLFPPNSIELDSDLTSYPGNEIRCLMGQSMGKVRSK